MTIVQSPKGLTREQFGAICRLTHEVCGINLHEGKERLVEARLARRLRALELVDVDQYLDYLRGPSGDTEILHMVDALTTNKTSFFREPQHFDFLAERVIPEATARGSQLRLWSAGCSSGEEPFTIAMVALETLGTNRAASVRILATDISAEMLDKASEGVYTEAALAEVPRPLLTRYFEPIKGSAPRSWRVGSLLRRTVTFAQLNLMEKWPMRGPFDAIFCRNVMIYFDRETRDHLVERFRRLLHPEGYLLVGHSESLTGAETGLSYVQPAVYAR
ncbi:MAG: protein-glutamate O-methyltransferase [Armatimonadia bacterium]